MSSSTGVALDAHLRIGCRQRRDRQRMRGHVDFGIGKLEPAQAGKCRLRLRECQSVGSQANGFQLQAGRTPGHVDPTAELPIERRHEALRQIRRSQRKRQRIDIDLHVRKLVGAIAPELHGSAIEHQRPAEGGGLVHRPGNRGRFERNRARLDVRGRVGGLVLPADGAAAEGEAVDLHAHLRLHGSGWRGIAARCGRFGRRLRGHLFGGARRRIRHQQIQSAGRLAQHVDLRRDQRDPSQVIETFERPDIGQRNVQRFERQQIARPRVDHRDATRIDRAGDLEPGGGRFLEIDLELGVQKTGLQLERKSARDIAEVRRQIEPLEAQLRIGLAVVRERRRGRIRIEGDAVELEGQLRLGRDVALGIEVAQERYLQDQVAQLVLAADGPVVEIERPAGDGDVVDGETCRLARRRCGCAREPREDVVDVVMPILQMREPECGILDRHRVDDRRQTQQRLHLGVRVDAVDRHLSGTAVGCRDAQIAQRELECPRLEIDRSDGDLAPEFLRRNPLQLALRDRRHRKPCDQPEAQQRQGRDRDAAYPFVLHERSAVHRASVPQKQTGFRGRRPNAASRRKRVLINVECRQLPGQPAAREPKSYFVTLSME